MNTYTKYLSVACLVTLFTIASIASAARSKSVNHTLRPITGTVTAVTDTTVTISFEDKSPKKVEKKSAKTKAPTDKQIQKRQAKSTTESDSKKHTKRSDSKKTATITISDANKPTEELTVGAKVRVSGEYNAKQKTIVADQIRVLEAGDDGDASSTEKTSKKLKTSHKK